MTRPKTPEQGDDDELFSEGNESSEAEMVGGGGAKPEAMAVLISVSRFAGWVMAVLISASRFAGWVKARRRRRVRWGRVRHFGLSA